MKEFKLIEKRKGLRDWFWGNSNMIRDDFVGDKWVISKKKFNEFIELLANQDKECFELLKEDLFGGAYALSDNEMIELINKRTGFEK